MSSKPADREDFRATGDPALAKEGRVAAQLLGYDQLYSLWERQQWSVAELDFSQDRIDWQERFSPEEQEKRLYSLSSFFVGEQRVAAELGPMVRAAPSEDMRIFLCTQMADEARHVAFFNRFYEEAGILSGGRIEDRIEAVDRYLNPSFGTLFDELLAEKVDRVAREPDDLEALVEAITIYHMVVEGMLALTGQHFLIAYNEQMGTLPGFVAGFTFVARDEHRHVAFGAKFLAEMTARDDRYRKAIERTLATVLPAAEGVLKPTWLKGDGDEGKVEVFGTNLATVRAFAVKALQRRLKAIGLV